MVARGRQDPRGAGTRAWLLHVEHDGMAAACCCWIGGSLSRASTVLPPPAGLPTRWMRARRHACVCQRDAVDGWAIIWGVAVRSDLCLFLSLCNCVGVVGGASERIMADGDAPADVTTAGSDRSPAEDAPVRADLSICLTLRARMHGLACLPDWPAGPVWLPQRQCRAVRSAIVLLVNDRSILRPAGAVCMLPGRPVLAYFSVTHSTQQDMSALYHLCQCNRVYCCFISCGCVLVCEAIFHSSCITFSIAPNILKLTLQTMFCTKYT